MINIDENFYDLVKKGEKPDYYKDWYDKIVNNAKTRGSSKKSLDYYTEEHHILPKCLGGVDESSNLVLLTAKEHIIVHILLHRAYPDNTKLAHAANCMILLRNSKERSKEIDLLDLNLLSELRELSGNLLKKSMVCYIVENDEDSVETVTVCKIYDSIVDTESDGFNKSCIYEAEKHGRTYCGYFWLKLTEAEEVIPQAILEYRDKINAGELINSVYREKNKQNTKRDEQIICFKNNTIFRIYDKLSDCSKDGFCLHNVSNVLNGRRSEHFGYSWSYKSDFLKSEINTNILNSFLESGDIPELTFPSKKIICCDKDNNILRIYNKLSDVVLEGFNKEHIRSLLNDVGSGIVSEGFYWYRYDDWKDKNKLEDFQLLVEEGKLPKLEISNKRLNSPNIIIKCDSFGNIDEIYKNIVDIKKSDNTYSLNKIKELFNDDIFSLEGISTRKYKDYYWFRVIEFNKLFPGKVDEFLRLEGIDEFLEKSETVLNLVLTVSSKLISVNELYKAKIINKGGRSYPTLYKNPKAVKVSEEIRNQLLSVDFSKYIKWLRKTKKYYITINFVLKSGISQRDCANFEKIMCDDLVKFIKNDLGITHFDDSEFLEVRLIKSIIPNAKNEYALIQLKESRHDVRFDHVDTPKKIYLAGPSFPTGDFNWKSEILPYILSNNLTYYDPSINFLDSDTRSIEKYHNCNVILYMFYPTIFEQMPDICSKIMRDVDFILENGNHSFLWIGILGELDVWGDYSNQIMDLYNYINECVESCSRIKIKFITTFKEILE